jgi:hypothetical protein
MTSPQTTAKREREHIEHKNTDGRRRASALLRDYLLIPLISAIIGMVAAPLIARLAPSPRVRVSLRGVRPTKGNGQGCIYYTVDLQTDKELDYVYMKIELPNTITDHKFGYPQEAHTSDGSIEAQFSEEGKGSGGECALIEVAGSSPLDVQEGAAGDTIEVHVTKMSPNSHIEGQVVTTSYSSSLKPAGKYFEGAFEYEALGQRVRRPVTFVDKGVSD